MVRASRFAHLWGTPIPVYGLAMYGALALLIFIQPLLSAQLAKLVGDLVALISGAGFLFSAYLTYLEAFVIRAWCLWCVVSALTVACLFALSLRELARPEPRLSSAEALRLIRRQTGLLAFALILGVPSFWLLAKHGELPPPKAPSVTQLEAHLTRPGTHFSGNPDAAVTIVEFGDFECPMCRQAEAAAREVRKRLGNEVRFAFRQFPLALIHPQAEKAAEASECAAQQGKFWEAADKIYAGQGDLSLPVLERDASAIGLNMAQFNQCLNSRATEERVAQDKADGRALGVRGTPTFFINGKMHEGPLTYAQFAGLIDEQLARQGSSSASKSLASKASLPTKSFSSLSTISREPVNAATGASAPSSLGGALPDGGGSNAFSGFQSGGIGCSEAEAEMRQPEMIQTLEASQFFLKPPHALFVDVRTPEEFKQEHIPGAINLPLETFEKNLSRLPKQRTIVLYESGRSSGDICAASREAGRLLLLHDFPFSQVKVFQGGLAAWQRAGFPVER